MEEKIREQFQKEIRKLLQYDKKEPVPVKLEIQIMKELPDLSEWREKK